MAIDLGDAGLLTISSGTFPADTTDLSFCFWVNQQTPPSSGYANLFHGSNSGGSAGEVYFSFRNTSGNGGRELVSDIASNASGEARLIETLSDNTWYFVAWKCSGGGATDAEFFVSGVSDSGWANSITFDGHSHTSWGNFQLGQYGTSTGTRFDGYIAAFKLFDRALTSDELLNEKWSYRPHADSCIVCSPFLDMGANDFIDYADGRSWTETDTVTTGVAGPPISWGAPVRRIILPSGAAPAADDWMPQIINF